MCPREGKECNEYMCGQSIDGICGGKPKESDYDRGYQQGRADAIDLVEKLKNKYESFTHEEYYVSAMISDLEDLLEQLKEQENE